MYGMLLESVQHFLATQHGEENWNSILEKAGAKNTLFTTHRRYKDTLMVDLAEVCSSVLLEGNSCFYMHYFGKCFVEYFTHYGYDKILRVSGRYYRDFLHGIDNLHETMRFSFPKMLSPSFYVDQEDANGCILHYHSKRCGFTHYVIGQLQQCARMFYHQEVEVEVLSEDFGEKGLHVIYRLNFDNSAFTPLNLRKASPAVKTYPTFSAKTFFKVFPFCIVFNEQMVITRVGTTILELFKRNDLIGQNIVKCFTLRRPLVEFTWNNILQLQNVIFELRSSYAIHRKCNSSEAPSCDCCNHRGRKRALLLKGQMRFMNDFRGVAFLCNPLINSLEDLRETGLYVNDLNMYDSSRHIVIAGYQHASSLEFSIEKQMEKTQQIADNLRVLDEWKLKSENLLYSMIPRTIADRLRRGEDPISTCESFEEVTVMFTYLIGFSEKCAKMSAQQLVQNVNSIFSCFDAIVDTHQVLKVETVGDAVYMVAGGVPQRTNEHAQNVAAVALELREAVKMRFQNLKIRIGMHTGSVVAGVVGRRMPQYCLFGDTVNTASRMQTFGQGKGYMNTYWLAGRRGDMETMRACKELRQETRQLLSLEGVSTLSNASLIDDDALVEFPRRKKSDASIYEDLARQQRKMQNRGDRRSVPNVLATLQGSFHALQERSESSMSTLSTISTDTVASPVLDENKKATSLLDLRSPLSILRRSSFVNNAMSDDEDEESDQGNDEKEEVNVPVTPLKTWMTRLSSRPLRRRSSSDSFADFEEEEEDRNSLSDTEFTFVKRVSYFGASAKSKRTVLLPRKFSFESADGLGRSWSESYFQSRSLGTMRRVSESMEDYGAKSPVLERFAASLNGYISSSSDDEFGSNRNRSPAVHKSASHRHVTFLNKNQSSISESALPKDNFVSGDTEDSTLPNKLDLPPLDMGQPSVKSLKIFFEQKSLGNNSGCPFSHMFATKSNDAESVSEKSITNSTGKHQSMSPEPGKMGQYHTESAKSHTSGISHFDKVFQSLAPINDSPSETRFVFDSVTKPKKNSENSCPTSGYVSNENSRKMWLAADSNPMSRSCPINFPSNDVPRCKGFAAVNKDALPETRSFADVNNEASNNRKIMCTSPKVASNNTTAFDNTSIPALDNSHGIKISENNTAIGHHDVNVSNKKHKDI